MAAKCVEGKISRELLYGFPGGSGSGRKPGPHLLCALTQLAALGLILILLGAIQKKMFVWRTGFWGENNSGWHYDLMLVVMNLAIVFTGGGGWVLMK